MRILFLALWYSLRGYVRIRAKGFSAERFMNMAAFRGICLWDISYEGSSILMTAPMSGLSVLETCAEKTGCTMELLEKGGMPVFLCRLRRRQVWTAGVLCFAAGL